MGGVTAFLCFVNQISFNAKRRKFFWRLLQHVKLYSSPRQLILLQEQPLSAQDPSARACRGRGSLGLPTSCLGPDEGGKVLS